MRIGLTYTGSPEKHENYARWLRGEGDVSRGIGRGDRDAGDGIGGGGDEFVEVVRLSAGDDNLSEVGRLDGLVLSGGVDIHPSLYGGSMEYEKGPKDGWQLERDEFEKAALKKAWSLGLPVFGVCRGLQLINVCTGGTLVQDLGSIGDEVHQNKGVIDMEHGVFIEKNSLLGSIALKGGTINSAHHQSIDELGEGLRVNCVAEDGTIEGIEWAEPVGKPFMLAVQWHPERMFTNGFEDVWLYRDLRDRFIMEIRKNKGL